MDSNHFLMLILLRFELFDVFNGSSSKDQVSFAHILSSYFNYIYINTFVNDWKQSALTSMQNCFSILVSWFHSVYGEMFTVRCLW